MCASGRKRGLFKNANEQKKKKTRDISNKKIKGRIRPAACRSALFSCLDSLLSHRKREKKKRQLMYPFRQYWYTDDECDTQTCEKKDDDEDDEDEFLRQHFLTIDFVVVNPRH